MKRKESMSMEDRISTYEKITSFSQMVDELSYNTLEKYNWDKKAIEFKNPEFGSLGDIIKFFPGQLVAWLGAPKEGKTTLLFQLLLYMAKKFDRKAIICSSEHDMMYNAQVLNDMAKGAKQLITTNFVFIEPKTGVMTTQMLLDKIDEIIYDRKNDNMDITDIVIDPMNSVFNDDERMLGYTERLPLFRKFKKAAQSYGVTWHFTEHAKTKNRFQGKYLKLGDPDDYVSGREILSAVDAFMTVNRLRVEKQVSNLDETQETISVKTNVAEVCNLGSKYQQGYKEGYIRIAFNPITQRYQFGDYPEWSEFDRRYIMRGNPVTPLSIFDKDADKFASVKNNTEIAEESNTEDPF